jgi:hypothetical protein
MRLLISLFVMISLNAFAGQKCLYDPAITPVELQSICHLYRDQPRCESYRCAWVQFRNCYYDPSTTPVELKSICKLYQDFNRCTSFGCAWSN